MTYEEITNKFICGSANRGINSTLTHYGNNRQPTPVLRRYAESTSVQRRFQPWVSVVLIEERLPGRNGKIGEKKRNRV